MSKSNSLSTIRLLLVENDKNEIYNITKLLDESEIANFEILVENTLETAVKRDRKDYDVALINLDLPDSHGIATVKTFKKECPDAPVVALTSVDDEIFTVTAIQAGIEDCIVSGNYNKNMLVKTLCFSMERHQKLRIMDDIVVKKETHFLTHDQLTNLPNKRYLIQFLNESIASDTDSKKGYTLINLELQGLIQVNYTLGLSYGDTLLKTLARRLEDKYQGNALIFRSESFQFSILLNQTLDGEELTQFSEDLLIALREPVSILNEKVLITTSMGISRYPIDTQDPEDLIEKAYVATKIAKEDGWHQYCVYSRKVSNQVAQYTAVFYDLQTALANNEFFLLIQPKINLRTGEIVRGEVLLRWQHPKLGLISPGQFIKIAEETHLIISIGYWLIYSALNLIRDLKKKYPDYKFPPIDVNISPVQMAQLNFIDLLEKLFYEASDALPYLGVEVTETAIMSNQRDADNVINYLRTKNVHISIDDFGTGYSSLTYLKQLPADSVKIDRSFISDVHKLTHNAEIVKSTIDMVRSLGLGVIAEGAEKEEEVKFLLEHGCDEVQGFYFAKPMLPEDFLLRAQGQPFEIPTK